MFSQLRSPLSLGAVSVRGPGTRGEGDAPRGQIGVAPAPEFLGVAGGAGAAAGGATARLDGAEAQRSPELADDGQGDKAAGVVKVAGCSTAAVTAHRPSKSVPPSMSTFTRRCGRPSSAARGTYASATEPHTPRAAEVRVHRVPRRGRVTSSPPRPCARDVAFGRPCRASSQHARNSRRTARPANSSERYVTAVAVLSCSSSASRAFAGWRRSPAARSRLPVSARIVAVTVRPETGVHS